MTTLKERPIIFGGEMVKAILQDRKFQTRRVIKPQPSANLDWVTEWGWTFFTPDKHISGRVRNPAIEPREVFLPCPYALGMRLWVRETWAVLALDSPARSCMVAYRADDELSPATKVYRMGVPESAWPKAVGLLARRWRPSIFMPRFASRLTLEIVSVKVERLQTISEIDCECELGVEPFSLGNEAYPKFRTLWDSINAKRGYPWDSNPFVWRIEFRRIV